MTPLISFYNILKTLNHLGRIKYFIQIGAHDGEMHDPLRSFILKNNWRGLFIDPQEDMLEKCRKNYQNKENFNFINTAIHPTALIVTLYKAKNPKDYSHTGWASINPGRFKDTIYENNVTTEEVQGLHLMQIIKKNKIKTLDLLQIDTEGYDWEILKMYDFHFDKPLLIQYEHCHLSKKDYVDSINYLKGYDYICVSKKNDTFALRKDIINPIFIASYFFVRILRSLNARLLRTALF